MTTANMYSSAPKPIYDVQNNDFVNPNYKVLIGNDGFDVDSEESFYPLAFNGVQAPMMFPYPFQQPNNLSYFQLPQMGLAPTFPTNGPTYNRGMAPTFQPYTALPHSQTTASPFTTPPSLASSSSTPLQYALTPSPVPLRGDAQKVNPKSKPMRKRASRKATQSAKELLIGKPKRKRGPNKRPPGTAFSNLLDGLTDEVREALEMDYTGCCESVNLKDVSTKQKHMFSFGHRKNLPTNHQALIPNFVCPAFFESKGNCRSKAGRYDSTDRHCKNCFGYLQINENKNDAFPVVITRAQYDAIQYYRVTYRPDSTEQPTEEDKALIRMTLANVFKEGFPDWLSRIDVVGGSNNTAAIVTAGSTASASAQLPTNTTSASAPVTSNSEQPPPYEPSLFDPATADVCAEAYMDAFPLINHEGQSNVSDVFMDQPSTSSVPDPAPADQSEPSSFYEPFVFNLEGLNGWGPILDNLDNFLQN